MDGEQPVQFSLMINPDDLDAEQRDQDARRLLGELRDQPVESAELAASGAAPQGAKGAEAITLGTIAVSVLPAFIPKVVDFLQAWALRGSGRTVKIKLQTGQQDIEFEGTPADFKTILPMLHKLQPK